MSSIVRKETKDSRVQWRVATGVSKENVSPDQPRSSSLESAFDATAEIFTSFDLAFRWDSLPVLWLVDPDHALHVRVTRSLEHYQPLCMPDASALICRYAYIHVRVRAFVCVYGFVYVYRTADFGYIREYIRPIHGHIGTCSIPGGVPFRRCSVGFRYDTVDRTARIFDIGGVISRQDKGAPQDAWKIFRHRFTSGCMYLYTYA